MLAPLVSIGRLILGTLRDLAPIIVVIAFFQIVVLRQPVPDIESIIGGLVLVMVGLALFIQGLEMGLFPLGESMADAFARKGSLFWLLAFAFALGFGTTVAEPALIAVAGEAAGAAAEAGLIAANEAARGARIAPQIGVLPHCRRRAGTKSRGGGKLDGRAPPVAAGFGRRPHRPETRHGAARPRPAGGHGNI